jgi:hypothetical protein
MADRGRRRDSGGMPTCAICLQPIEGPQLRDPETAGGVYHPACVAAQIPQELAVAGFALLVQVLGPTVALWAA